MMYLMRISTFWVSACEGLSGVFFASFSNWSNLSTPAGGVILSLARGLVMAGDMILEFYFSKVEVYTQKKSYLCTAKGNQK
jgi:hypothetical protein